MPASGPDLIRAKKLNDLFSSVLQGNRPLKSQSQGSLFVEAVVLPTDPPTCAGRIISSPNGLASLQACLRFNASSEFHNGPAAQLIRYFQDPDLKAVQGGNYLQQILLCMVEPPIFWNSFEQSFRHGLLDDAAQQCFGWLLYELINLPPNKSENFRRVAEDNWVQGEFLNSPSFDLRALGQKIKHVLSTLLVPTEEGQEGGPGGRHDNDFTDFRDIAIHPTADEILSKEDPFFRRAEEIDDPERAETRIATHLDNQFRLLREDMLGEMREELQIVSGEKKGRHRGLIADGFTVHGIVCGDVKRRLPWSLQLKATTELPRIFNCKLSERIKFLTENRNIFKHQSLVCLVLDGNIAAFPTIHRDVESLAEKFPIVTLQFRDEPSTCKALTGLKLTDTVRLVQIDTAVFAFEPILRHLQRLTELPLAEELLFWELETPMRQPSFTPVNLVTQLQNDPEQDLQSSLDTKLPVHLDSSQMQSLLNGLEQKVSLIQGPPGNLFLH